MLRIDLTAETREYALDKISPYVAAEPIVKVGDRRRKKVSDPCF